MVNLEELKKLRKKISKCWCRETIWHKSDWSPECPSYGQCYVTALLVQNILGGKVIAGEVDYDTHYWNKLPDGTEIDFTSDQFNDGDGIHPHSRREEEAEQTITNSDRRCGRYLLLKKRFNERFQTNNFIECTKPCSEGKPCLPDGDKCPLEKEINLDNLVFQIRKSTPKYYRRAKIWVKKGKARIVITDEEKWLESNDGMKGIASLLNHEFIHWILCSLIGCKWGLKKYDKFLEWQNLYWFEVLMETWL
jgi:hypothetical protein